jgi:hypothetical protein
MGTSLEEILSAGKAIGREERPMTDAEMQSGESTLVTDEV